MVFNFTRKSPSSLPGSLSELEQGGSGIVGEFDLPEQVAEQLMNLGLVPGLKVTAAQSGPGGDPRVYRVDGTEIALRGDLSRRIKVVPLGLDESSLSTKSTTLEEAARQDHAGQPVASEALRGHAAVSAPNAVEGEA